MTEPLGVGVPNWVDLASPDVEASVRFYGELLGWTAQEGSPEFGGYRMFERDGKFVAGVGPVMMEGQPTAWTTYFRTADSDATSAAVKAAGGTVVVEPMQVGDSGRMTVFGDPAGGFAGTWENGEHHGMQLWNQPGAVVWNELSTRDLEKAKAFYGEVFGWTFSAMGDPATYWTFDVDGRPTGGMMAMPPGVPDQVPSYWLVYFACDDLEAGMARAVELGGAKVDGPIKTDFGPIAVMTDPQGATFALMELTSAGG